MVVNAPKKFLFDTSFEPEHIAEKEKPVEAPPEPKYFEEDLERARAEGLATGEGTGRESALQGIEQSATQTLASLEKLLPELRQELVAIEERQAYAAVEVSTALVRKIFPRLVQDHGLGEIESVVREAMARLRDEPRIVVRVCDAMLDTVKDRVGALARDAGFEGAIVFLAENNMAPGDVRIEWADGGAERDTERVWQEIEDMIRHMIGALKTQDETAPTPSGPDGTQGATA